MSRTRTNKTIRKLTILILSLVFLFVNGCGEEPSTEYAYEYVEVEIVEINTKHWFAGTHRYEWDIEVYYEPYDLYFKESSCASGAFSCPSFFGKSEGDKVNVCIRNKYVNGELVERKIENIN